MRDAQPEAETAQAGPKVDVAERQPRRLWRRGLARLWQPRPEQERRCQQGEQQSEPALHVYERTQPRRSNPDTCVKKLRSIARKSLAVLPELASIGEHSTLVPSSFVGRGFRAGSDSIGAPDAGAAGHVTSFSLPWPFYFNLPHRAISLSPSTRMP